MKLNKTLFAVIAATLVLAACGDKPESVVQSFYRAVENGEITEARGYISKDLVGMLGDKKIKSTLESESTRVTKCGGFKDVIVALTGQGEVRTGTVNLSYKGDCKEKSEKVKLVKEDGNWKVTANK